jgi:nicotinic acid mononucleotide adenylyltransferase
MKRRVSILGFSANPPTDSTGHAGIIQHLISSEEYDEIWVLPVYVHIFTTKRDLERFEHRLAMCRLLATSLSTSKVLVKASDLERTVYLDEYNKHLISNPLGNPNVEVKIGTIDIIRYIRATYKDYDLLSINLGADSYNDLVIGKWKHHVALLSEICIQVFFREGFADPLPKPSIAKEIRFIQLKGLKDTSSTVVRNSQPGLLADWPFSIPYYIEQHKASVGVVGEIYDYILSEKIYFYSKAAVNKRLQRRAAILGAVLLVGGILLFVHYGSSFRFFEFLH